MLRFVLAVAFALHSASTFASVEISGFSAAFSAPQFVGDVLNPDGSTTHYDNTLTNEVSFETSTFVRWGSGAQVAAPGFNPSALAFIPNSSFAGTVSDGDVVNLGTLLYLNGNSDLTKLIFGLTLTISASTSDGQIVDPLALDVDIFTTVNFDSDPAWSADFLEASGLGLTGTTSLHAYENGDVFVADLYGTVVGDPMLAAVNFVITSGPGSGFIGTGPLAAPAVPEATTFAIWGGLGLCGAAVAYRSKRKLSV